MVDSLKGIVKKTLYRDDYFADFNNAYSYYQKKHMYNHRKFSLKLMIWLFRSLLRKYNSDNNSVVEEELTVCKEDILDVNSSKLNIGFLFGGGYGDILIAANYVYKFKEKFGDINIDVFVHDSQGLVGAANTIFYDGHVIRKLYPMKGYETVFEEYDLFIRCNRVPNAIHVKTNRLSEINPGLLGYYYETEKYKKLNERYYSKAGITDGQSALMCVLEGKKRIQQPDVYGILGISEYYEYPLLTVINEDEYLKNLELKNQVYITVHRGLDTRFSKKSTKLWPVEYYDILIKMIKKKYPSVKIVEIGASHDRCPEFEGVDLNLVEQTSMEEIKILLKNSILHIDGEGGMVHLRHALKAGPSIVLFGPTDYRFFGYSENCNIKGNGCKVSCEWAIRGWNVECLRGEDIPPCMASIIPEDVFEKVKNIIGS